MQNGFLLASQIQNGYRMPKPKYSPNFIGEMLTNCWQKEPKNRPTFSQLAEVIEKQIETVVSIDYLNMMGAENSLIRDIVDDPTLKNHLGIVKLFNETTPSPMEGIENLSFFGGSHDEQQD